MNSLPLLQYLLVSISLFSATRASLTPYSFWYPTHPSRRVGFPFKNVLPAKTLSDRISDQIRKSDGIRPAKSHFSYSKTGISPVFSVACYSSVSSFSYSSSAGAFIPGAFTFFSLRAYTYRQWGQIVIPTAFSFFSSFCLLRPSVTTVRIFCLFLRYITIFYELLSILFISRPFQPYLRKRRAHSVVPEGKTDASLLPLSFHQVL